MHTNYSWMRRATPQQKKTDQRLRRDKGYGGIGEQHLAFNTVMYAALIVVEQRHVAHHIATLRRTAAAAAAVPTEPVRMPTETPAVAA